MLHVVRRLCEIFRKWGLTGVAAPYETVGVVPCQGRMKDDKSAKNGGKNTTEGTRNAGLALSIPAVMVAAAVVGCVIGLALDKWLGTGPWVFLLFMFLGLAAGARETIRLVQKINKK